MILLIKKNTWNLVKVAETRWMRMAHDASVWGASREAYVHWTSCGSFGDVNDANLGVQTHELLLDRS